MKTIKKYRSEILLILVGSIVWSLTMIKSGLVYDFGIGYWGPNGHDGVWHLAVIEGLVRGSWEMPIFSGELITNYHVGFDLLVAWIHKITLIPVSVLYFQIIPPLLALFTGLAVWKFVHGWKKSKPQAFWATFFVYFGAGFGFLVTLAKDGRFGGESLFWSQQSASTLINPPFALSLFIIFVGLILLQRGLPKESKKLLTITTFLFGLLIQIKVYAGILMLGALLIASLLRIIRRKGLGLFKVFMGSLIISILLFSPMNREAGNSLIFKPFWFLETMMQFPDRLSWSKYGEAMVNYKLGKVIIKGVIAYLLALGIFIVGNFGARIISIKYLLDKKLNLSYLDLIFYSVIGAGIFLPLIYVQRGTAWNTLQFMYYSLMFSGVLAGISFGKLLEKRKLGKRVNLFITILVLLLTIPSTYGTLKHYVPKRPPAKISQEELEALRFLEEQPTGVVLTQLYDQKKAELAQANPPRPLYLYETTAYVAAYAKKPTFLEDEVNLEITGYSWKKRRGLVEELFESGNLGNFVKENSISYIYWIKDTNFPFDINELGLTKIFENDQVLIIKT